MTRRSFADTYYEEAEDEPNEAGCMWLLLYDFKGKKPSTRFWSNLNHLKNRGAGASLIQYSALVTRSRRVARTIERLAEHYGAETIMFSGVHIDACG
jgi:hypothetical protein